MPVEETLQTLHDVEELVSKAIHLLESLPAADVPRHYDLTARNHLANALAQVTLGANVSRSLLSGADR